MLCIVKDTVLGNVEDFSVLCLPGSCPVQELSRDACVMLCSCSKVEKVAPEHATAATKVDGSPYLFFQELQGCLCDASVFLFQS